jgi:hypothetical protein
MRRIGDSLGADSLAEITGRNKHRPSTREELKVAVHELASRGYSDHSIAAATGLAIEQIRRLLRERPT